MVAFVQVAVAQESVQIPAKDEVLNTLKEQHPRLISTERVERIKRVIQEDVLAKKLWISNLEFAEELLDKSPVIYEKPDGRRLLRVSREALDRVRSLSLCYLILGEERAIRYEDTKKLCYLETLHCLQQKRQRLQNLCTNGRHNSYSH